MEGLRWIERMRAVGIQRQQQGQGQQGPDVLEDIPPLPGSGASVRLPPLNIPTSGSSASYVASQDNPSSRLPPVEEVERLSELRIRSTTATPRMASRSLPEILERKGEVSSESELMDVDGHSRVGG
jgi:hypothetical protein